MHYALVFSTSKQPASIENWTASNLGASTWLDDLSDHFAFLKPYSNFKWLDPGCAAEVMCQPGKNFTTDWTNNNSDFKALRTAAAARTHTPNL